jgi:hypothetical protein
MIRMCTRLEATYGDGGPSSYVTVRDDEPNAATFIAGFMATEEGATATRGVWIELDDTPESYAAKLATLKGTT